MSLLISYYLSHYFNHLLDPELSKSRYKIFFFCVLFLMLAHWEQYLTHSKCPLNTWMNDWMNTKMCKPRCIHPNSNFYEASMLPLIEVLETVNRDSFPWKQWIILRWIAFRFQNASLLTFGIFEWRYIINSSQRSICSDRILKSKQLGFLVANHL